MKSANTIQCQADATWLSAAYPVSAGNREVYQVPTGNGTNIEYLGAVERVGDYWLWCRLDSRIHEWLGGSGTVDTLAQAKAKVLAGWDPPTGDNG